MKLSLVCVGHMRPGPEKEILELYRKRLLRPLPIFEVGVKKNLMGEALKAAEASLILDAVHPNAYLVALDERGDNLSSPEFSSFLEKVELQGWEHLSFIIGGAEGLQVDLRKKVNRLISLGRLTWPHMLVRALLMEQLYRCQQIRRGHPYHKI